MKKLMSSALMALITMSGCLFGAQSSGNEDRGSLLLSAVPGKYAGERNVVASKGASNNEVDKAVMFEIGISARGSHVQVVDITISFEKMGNAHISTVYLYEGSTELDSTTYDPKSGTALFRDIDLMIPKHGLKVLQVRIDIRNATRAQTRIEAKLDPFGVTALGFDKVPKPVSIGGVAKSGAVIVTNGRNYGS